MRVKNFGFGMPRELHDTQEWFCAIDAFDLQILSRLQN